MVGQKIKFTQEGRKSKRGDSLYRRDKNNQQQRDKDLHQ